MAYTSALEEQGTLILKVHLSPSLRVYTQPLSTISMEIKLKDKERTDQTSNLGSNNCNS